MEKESDSFGRWAALLNSIYGENAFRKRQCERCSCESYHVSSIIYAFLVTPFSSERNELSHILTNPIATLMYSCMPVIAAVHSPFFHA
jgi:hypothetical protein